MKFMLAILLAACGTTARQTNLGSFVTNVHFEGEALIVDQCDVVYGVDTDEAKTTAGVAATILLLPLAVATGGAPLIVAGEAKSHNLSTSQCGTRRDRVPNVGGDS